MKRFELEWQSTSEARYDTDMNERAATRVQPPCVLVGTEGGTDGIGADNILVIDAPSRIDAQRCAYAVQREVQYYVTVTEVGRDE